MPKFIVEFLENVLKTCIVSYTRFTDRFPLREIGGSWSEVAVAALATVAVLLVGILLQRKASQSTLRRLPPGPGGWPILGCLPLLSAMPHESLYELSKQYGPLMFMRLGSVKTLVVTSRKFAEEIFKTHDKIMASRPEIVVPSEFFYNGVDIAFAPYGQHWRYLRKVCTVGLLTAARINQFREVRQREVMAALHFILEESQRGNAVNMSECFSTMTMNNITQMMVNRSYCVHSSQSKSVLPNPLQKAIRETVELLGGFNISDYIPLLKPFDLQGLHKRSKPLHLILDKFIQEVIEEHRQRRSIANTENYKEDFIDALLGFGETQEFEERLSMDCVKAIILEMIVAGGNTSSVAALWALTELLRNPRVLRKVQEELDSVVGRHQLVQEEDLPKLLYLTAVIKETLRVHPPGPLITPRLSTGDCEIEGFHIPAGTQVIVSLWSIHRDPAVWERPLEFDPDRFLNSTTDFKGRDFEFLPFGAGRRICPGMNLAMLMVIYPLPLLVHALDWSLPDGQKPEELDMSETFGIVLDKKVPLTAFAKARLPHHVLYPAQELKQ
ncbi:unnamed protein product [Calypogeia fissa]